MAVRVHQPRREDGVAQIDRRVVRGEVRRGRGGAYKENAVALDIDDTRREFRAGVGQDAGGEESGAHEDRVLH